MVNVPTHVRGNALDLVLTNSISLISDLQVDPHETYRPFSDHFLISFSVSIAVNRPCKKKSSYAFDLHGLYSYLIDVDFKNCLMSVDLEFAWHSFSNILQLAMALFIPKVRLRTHQRLHWITPDLQHQLNSTNTNNSKKI